MKNLSVPVKLGGVLLLLLLLFLNCKPERNYYLSYAQVDFSKKSIRIIPPSGSSSIENLTLEDEGDLEFISGSEAWLMEGTEDEPLRFNLDLKVPTMLQVAMSVEFPNKKPSADYFDLKINGVQRDFYVLENANYDTTYVMIQIPEELTKAGNNTVEIFEDRSDEDAPLLEFIRFLPQKILAEKGVLNTTLFTQFGQTKLMQGMDDANEAKPFWTRSYGLSETTEMIPGPILYYSPGDLVNVELVNLLNPETSQALRDFDEVQRRELFPDEILSGHKVKGNLNIPHDLKFTNLHVHGLHVDPDRDNVLLVIEPDGVDMKKHSNPLMKASKKIDRQWVYKYQIPEIHLPGTHWYHPHKHGSTSAQLENGLSGTMVIMEDSSNAIVPFPGKAASVGEGGKDQTDYDLNKWRGEHDRVLAIQEISNFGLQQGQGMSRINTVATNFREDTPLGVTVNGIQDLQLEVKAGQLERWRLVNAGTNHMAYSHVWLGRNTGKIDVVSVKVEGKCNSYKEVKMPVYEPVDIYLVAVDGITLPNKVVVNASQPAAMAPGNRSDFLVQIDQPGEYVLFKNYQPKEGLAIQDQNGEIIYRSAKLKESKLWAAVASSTNNTFVFDETGSSKGNYMGFEQKWRGKEDSDKRDMVPLINVSPVENEAGKFLDVDFEVKSGFESGVKGWVPASANFATRTEAKVLDLRVLEDRIDPKESPQLPSDGYLNTIAPVTSGEAPGYVNNFDDEDILQSRPLTFDVSGIQIAVRTLERPREINVPQFTLNGRFFRGDDALGSPSANDFIKSGYKDPSDLGSDVTGEPVKLLFGQRGLSPWSNQVDKLWYFTNPGYYRPLKESAEGVFDYEDLGAQPSWQAITGIKDIDGKPQPAVVNDKAEMYDANKDLMPGLPLAKTGEEWILINNSDVNHPFHIHINPFFVTEVGQLSYENYTDASGNEKRDWFMRAVTSKTESPWAQRPEKPDTGAVPGSVYQGNISAGAIVGNWWDTLTIPAHGYVKVRYWFNIPQQVGEADQFEVNENVNRVGTWVYHCHILRHEDRGMMMLVKSEKSNEE